MPGAGGALAAVGEDLGDGLAERLNLESRLAYYKQRVEHAERELADVQAWVEQRLAGQADVHAAQWEARKREAENAQLRKALSDAHMFLWEEREARLKVQAENDALRLRELEDQRKMGHLLALHQPVAQELTIEHDQPPDGITRFPHALGVGAAERLAPEYAGARAGTGVSPRARKGVGGAHAKRNNSARARGAGSARARDERAPEKLVVGAAEADADVSLRGALRRSTRPSSAGAPTEPGAAGVGVSSGRVLRTVYLPNEKVESLVVSVANLRQQLREHEQLATQRISAMLEDRRRREEDVAAELSNARAAHEVDAKRLQTAQQTLAATMRDYLKLRHEASKRERHDREELTVRAARTPRGPAHAARAHPAPPPAIARRARSLPQRLRAASATRHLSGGGAGGEKGTAASTATAAAAQRAQEEAQEGGLSRAELREAHYRTQLHTAEEAKELLAEKHRALEQASAARIAALEATVRGLREQLRRLEVRRALDVEGFTRDASQLRRMLERAEKAWHKHAAANAAAIAAASAPAAGAYARANTPPARRPATSVREHRSTARPSAPVAGKASARRDAAHDARRAAEDAPAPDEGTLRAIRERLFELERKMADGASFGEHHDGGDDESDADA